MVDQFIFACPAGCRTGSDTAQSPPHAVRGLYLDRSTGPGDAVTGSSDQHFVRIDAVTVEKDIQGCLFAATSHTGQVLVGQVAVFRTGEGLAVAPGFQPIGRRIGDDAVRQQLGGLVEIETGRLAGSPQQGKVPVRIPARTQFGRKILRRITGIYPDSQGSWRIALPGTGKNENCREKEGRKGFVHNNVVVQ